MSAYPNIHRHARMSIYISADALWRHQKFCSDIVSDSSKRLIGLNRMQLFYNNVQFVVILHCPYPKGGK